jgi:hypothetical protein
MAMTPAYLLTQIGDEFSPYATPAGAAEDLQTSGPAWPAAARGVLEALNAVALNPGMPLESGTGFNAARFAETTTPESPPGQGTTITIPGTPGYSIQIPLYPPHLWGEPTPGTPRIPNVSRPLPGGGNLSGFGDLFRQPLSLETDLDIEELDAVIRRLKDYEIFGDDATAQAIRDYYKFPEDPPYSLLDGEALLESPVLNPKDFTLLGEDGTTLISPAVLDALELEGSGLLKLRELFQPGALDQAMQTTWGFTPSPELSLLGGEVPGVLNPEHFAGSLVDPTFAGKTSVTPGILGTAGSLLSLASLAYDLAQGDTVNPANVALAVPAGASLLSSGLGAAGLTSAAAAMAPLLGVLGPMGLVMAAPFVLGSLGQQLAGDFGWTTGAMHAPPGYINVPGEPRLAVDPKTGVILEMKGKGHGAYIEPSAQALAGEPATREQFLRWHIPSPLYPETADLLTPDILGRPPMDWTPTGDSGGQRTVQDMLMENRLAMGWSGADLAKPFTTDELGGLRQAYESQLAQKGGALANFQQEAAQTLTPTKKTKPKLTTPAQTYRQQVYERSRVDPYGGTMGVNTGDLGIIEARGSNLDDMVYIGQLAEERLRQGGGAITYWDPEIGQLMSYEATEKGK